MVRSLIAAACLLGACGRIDYELLTADLDAGPDAGADASDAGAHADASDAGAHADATDADAGAPGDGGVGRCTATPIDGFDWGVTAIADIAAAGTPDGFAVGGLAAPFSTFWGVHLDGSLHPNAAAPFHTSPVDGFDGQYVDGNLYWDGSLLTGTLSTDGDGVYVKTFATDMSAFTYASDLFAGRAGPTAQTRAGSTRFALWGNGAELSSATLDASGTVTGGVMSLGTLAAPIESVSVAEGEAALVAMSLTDGTCVMRSIAGDLSSIEHSVGGTCHRPFVIGRDLSHVVVFERGDGFIGMRSATTTLTPHALAVGSEIALVRGSAPRLVDGTTRWLTWVDGSLRAALLDPLAEVPIDGLPPGVPDAYETVSRPDAAYAFAAFGSTLWAIRCE